MTNKEQKESCKDCKHFIQHYTLRDGNISWVNCGHCVRHKIKRKMAMSASCSDFAGRPGGSERLVTKKYLTKELLQYVLSLELPPESANEPQSE